MGNVLDFRTYRAPSQKGDAKANTKQRLLVEEFDYNAIPLNEREAICYARGVAFHVMNWIRTCCIVKAHDDSIVEDLPSRFLVQIANSLLNYKDQAQNRRLDGVPHCTVQRLRSQVLNVIECDSHLREMWRKRDTIPSNSLALADKTEYSVEWKEGWEMEWRSLEQGAYPSFSNIFWYL